MNGVKNDKRELPATSVEPESAHDFDLSTIAMPTVPVRGPLPISAALKDLPVLGGGDGGEEEVGLKAALLGKTA